MNLADNGVPGNVTKLTSNLAGTQAFGPQLFQHFYAFVRPSHYSPRLLVWNTVVNYSAQLVNG